MAKKSPATVEPRDYDTARLVQMRGRIKDGNRVLSDEDYHAGYNQDGSPRPRRVWFVPTFYEITLTHGGRFMYAKVYDRQPGAGRWGKVLCKTYGRWDGNTHFPRYLSWEINRVCRRVSLEHRLNRMDLAELHEYVRKNGYYKANIERFRNYKRDFTKSRLIDTIMTQELEK